MSLRLLRPLLGNKKYAKLLGVEIGENTRIYLKEWGSEPFLITVGCNCTITNGVRFLTHDGATSLVRQDGVRFQRYGRIEIGDNVFVGIDSIILPGVRIASNSVVAAGSVVTKDVEEGTIVGGNPAKVIKKFQEYRDAVVSSGCRDDVPSSALTYKERVCFYIDMVEKK